MALKTIQRHVYLALRLTILVAALFPLVFGNDGCSGDGSVMDTCPEGEYCEGGSCHNCSLCSVNTLLQGAAPTKCLCMLTSNKICTMPATGEQLIERPSQLSFTNLTGYENIDFSHLKESYDRSSIDCTVPTTPEGTTTSVAFMPTTSATTLMPEEPEQTSSSSASPTKEAVTPTSENQVLIIVITVLAVVVLVAVVIIVILILQNNRLRKEKGCLNTGDLLIGILIGVGASILIAIVIAIVCYKLYKKRKGLYAPVNRDEGGAGDGQNDGGNNGENAGGRDDDGAGGDTQNDGGNSGGNAGEIAEEEV